MIRDYLQKIGFNEKEIAIYLVLAEIGIQPASIIAKKCRLDRVTTYKNLKKMAERGLIKIYYENGIQRFGIESFENLRVYLKEQEDVYDHLLQTFPVAENFLQTLRRGNSLIPKLQIFEGDAGLKNFFRDLLFEVESEHIRQIRMLTSNTFEERLGDVPLSKFVRNFFQEVQNKKIDLEIFEASGELMPERIMRLAPHELDPEKLPAARGTTNIFLAGPSVYIACYKTNQIGLKIKQPEMSQIFHFLFDFMAKKV